VDKTTRRSIDEVLADAQARLRRLAPVDAVAAMSDGWTLVDTRDGDVVARDGAIPGALRIPLSVLEWRVDPTSKTHSIELTGREERLILICRDGYSSSLAAIRLHELGFTDTRDVIGGFVAWRAAGLPVER
jgi:rhodanese-related sulfurtransferase